jgi:hypothetical protein
VLAGCARLPYLCESTLANKVPLFSIFCNKKIALEKSFDTHYNTLGGSAPAAMASPDYGWAVCLYAIVEKFPGSGTTALSQPGRHSGGAKPLERQCFPVQSECTFSHYILGMQFLPFFTQ